MLTFDSQASPIYSVQQQNSFISWEQLDRHIQIYAKQNGFVAIILGSESDDITRKRCRYAFNASCPKTTGVIKITSSYLEHNHEIHPNNIIFDPHYRQFPDEAKQDIEYYTSKDLNMLIQLSLLENKYPDILYLPHDLSLSSNYLSNVIRLIMKHLLF
ncbi:16544_t:CDS:2 [Gigaspora margarita]|uniref:16544_t:CDS:1 n=1 Tax=Gigaspora margarita TaxID=4874 RepID=A0ABM8W798_GIGMA|nr:16544_t:CDS:2 [Gigaspora margarita]